MQYNYIELAIVSGAEKDCSLHDEYMEVFYEVFGFRPTNHPYKPKTLVIPKPTWLGMKELWTQFAMQYSTDIQKPTDKIVDELTQFLTKIKLSVLIVLKNEYTETSKPQ